VHQLYRETITVNDAQRRPHSQKQIDFTFHIKPDLVFSSWNCVFWGDRELIRVTKSMPITMDGPTVVARGENDDRNEVIDDDDAAYSHSVLLGQRRRFGSCWLLLLRRRRTRHLLLQCIFLLLGIGILVPWNAFISAKGYFQSRLCASPYERINIESTFAMVYNLASVISLALIIGVQALRDQWLVEEDAQHGANENSSRVFDSLASNAESGEAVEGDPLNGGERDATAADNNNIREPIAGQTPDHSILLVVVPLSLYLIAFLGQTIMVFAVDMDFFFQMTVLSLAVCGMACGVAQAGIVATASLFPADLAMNPYLAVRCCAM
jgi:hypothetical protein